jgi:hypothetical protein
MAAQNWLTLRALRASKPQCERDCIGRITRIGEPFACNRNHLI